MNAWTKDIGFRICNFGLDMRKNGGILCLVTNQVNFITEYNTVSVVGGHKGYMVRYNHLPKGVPAGTPEGKGLCFTVVPESSPNTDIISF